MNPKFLTNAKSKSSQSQIVYSCIRATGLHCKYNNTHIQFFLNSNNLYIKIISCKIVLSSCVDISLLKLWIDGAFKKTLWNIKTSDLFVFFTNHYCMKFIFQYIVITESIYKCSSFGMLSCLPFLCLNYDWRILI